MRKYTRWLIITLLLIAIPLGCIAGFNFYIDPLWNFRHSNQDNQVQQSFDERQQKTNLVGRGDFNYDTLMLGSSRASYIDQHDFTGHRVFNYAVSSMTLDEYEPYIAYATEKNGQEFDYIILGLDFYATNRNIKKEFHEPAYYINKSQEAGYRYKTLLSLDVMKYAINNLRASRAGVPQSFAYNRQNVKTLNQVSDEERDLKITKTVETYQEKMYANYEYEDVKTILMNIKKNNPHTKFIVYTSPVALPLYQLMEQNELMTNYEQWLRDSVAVFGQVYNFMEPNSITENMDNFYDASHIYPQVGGLLAHRILGIEDDRIPADFGGLLNSENLDNYLLQAK